MVYVKLLYKTVIIDCLSSSSSSSSFYCCFYQPTQKVNGDGASGMTECPDSIGHFDINSLHAHAPCGVTSGTHLDYCSQIRNWGL